MKDYSNNEYVKRSIISVFHGSHAYGLNTSESDEDIRGILVESSDQILSSFSNFGQIQQHQHDGFEVDLTIFGLKKFAKLAAEANPNVLEILFVEPSEIIKIDKFGKCLIENRDIFLSKKIYNTFCGYAKGQLSRLNGHRKWMVDPPSPPMSREEFGLPSSPELDTASIKAINASISKKLDSWNLKDLTDENTSQRVELLNSVSEMLEEMRIGADDKWWAAGKVIGMNSEIMFSLAKERQYENIIREYKQYLFWKESRNPKRFATEQACGCDTKNASHLIRLYLQCIDVLEGKGLILKQKQENRLLLLDIKQGKFGKDTFNVVTTLKDELEIKAKEALKNSTLPDHADTNKIDSIIKEIYFENWTGMNTKQLKIAENLLINR